MGVSAVDLTFLDFDEASHLIDKHTYVPPTTDGLPTTHGPFADTVSSTPYCQHNSFKFNIVKYFTDSDPLSGSRKIIHDYHRLATCTLRTR